MDIRLNNVVQAWFINWDSARVECRNLCVILIKARYLMTKIGNARPRHETDVASPNHGNPHSVFTPCDFLKNRKNRAFRQQRATAATGFSTLCLFVNLMSSA